MPCRTSTTASNNHVSPMRAIHATQLYFRIILSCHELENASDTTFATDKLAMICTSRGQDEVGTARTDDDVTTHRSNRAGLICTLYPDRQVT